MSSSTPPGNNVGRHGGARSVLCWQDKLGLLDESAIVDFVSRGDCGCECNCMGKIRAMDERNAVQIIRELRTARMAGINIIMISMCFAHLASLST